MGVGIFDDPLHIVLKLTMSEYKKYFNIPVNYLLNFFKIENILEATVILGT